MLGCYARLVVAGRCLGRRASHGAARRRRACASSSSGFQRRLDGVEIVGAGELARRGDHASRAAAGWVDDAQVAPSAIRELAAPDAPPTPCRPYYCVWCCFLRSRSRGCSHCSSSGSGRDPRFVKVLACILSLVYVTSPGTPIEASRTRLERGKRGQMQIADGGTGDSCDCRRRVRADGEVRRAGGGPIRSVCESPPRRPRAI